MAELVTNPDDPRLTHGSDDKPTPQADAYLVLSEEERTKGFVRPVRKSYIHVGKPGPKYELRDLTAAEKERHPYANYYKFEEYPMSEFPALGRFWTKKDLENVNRGCQQVTSMSQALAETYAAQPDFYGATYCAHCQMHRPVEEFVWVSDGTTVGS